MSVLSELQRFEAPTPGEIEAQRAVERDAMTLGERSAALTVETETEYLAAGEFLKDVNAMERSVVAFFAPMKKAAHDAHKAVCARESETLKPITEARRRANRLMSDFYQLQERERQRIESEQRVAAQKRAEEEQLERAAQLESEGRREEAEAVLDAPVEAPVIVPAAVAVHVPGTAVRHNWRFRVIDQAKVKPAFLMVDDVKVGKTVRALHKDAEEAVGGIQVWDEISHGTTGR